MPDSLMQQIREYVVPKKSVALWWLGQNGYIFKTPEGTLASVDLYLTEQLRRAWRPASDLSRAGPGVSAARGSARGRVRLHAQSPGPHRSGDDSRPAGEGHDAVRRAGAELPGVPRGGRGTGPHRDRLAGLRDRVPRHKDARHVRASDRYERPEPHGVRVRVRRRDRRSTSPGIQTSANCSTRRRSTSPT